MVSRKAEKKNYIPTITQDIINYCHKCERVTYLCVMLHPGTEYSISWDKPDADSTILFVAILLCVVCSSKRNSLNWMCRVRLIFHTEFALPVRLHWFVLNHIKSATATWLKWSVVTHDKRHGGNTSCAWPNKYHTLISHIHWRASINLKYVYGVYVLMIFAYTYTQTRWVVQRKR